MGNNEWLDLNGQWNTEWGDGSGGWGTGEVEPSSQPEPLSPTDFNYQPDIPLPQLDPSTKEGRMYQAIITKLGITWEEYCRLPGVSTFKLELESGWEQPFAGPDEDIDDIDDYRWKKLLLPFISIVWGSKGKE